MRLTIRFLSMLVPMLLALTGCSMLSTLDHDHPQRPLSEAMHKASDEYTGQRTIHHQDHSMDSSMQPDPEPDVEIQAAYAGAAAASPGVSHNEDVWFSLRGGAGVVPDEYFSQTRGLDLMMEIADEPGRSLRLLAGFQTLTLRENGNIVRQAVENDPLLFSLGAEYKFFETPRALFMGMYLLGGVQFNWMVWTYKNAVRVEHGETITMDALGGIDLYPALGVRLMQIESAALNLELRPGIKIWYDETNEGFRNDLFHPTPYVRVDATVAFGAK